MKSILKFASVLILLGAVASKGVAQKIATLPLTADSLATGNSKDVLKSFFQLAFDKLTGQNKELQFSSNPFAVMAKMDTTLLIDTNYIKYTHLRNLNFSFGAKLDSSYHFNGFSSGIKYALINQRDETVSREFVTAAYEANGEFNKLTFALAGFVSTLKPDDPRFALYSKQSADFLSGKINFSQVDKTFQEIIKARAKDAGLQYFLTLVKNDANVNIGSIKQKSYQSLREEFQKGLLWTVGLSDTTYKNQFLFSNILVNTEVVKGFGQATPGLNTELNILAAINFLDDTLAQGRDLKRSIFTFAPGLNFVFRTKNTLKSFFELKFSGSYRHSFHQLYTGEERDQLAFTGALRVRIFNDVWIPLVFNYDPESGHVFGFLNVRANFTGLASIVSGHSSK